jgi:hypothetical protein
MTHSAVSCDDTEITRKDGRSLVSAMTLPSELIGRVCGVIVALEENVVVILIVYTSGAPHDAPLTKIIPRQWWHYIMTLESPGPVFHTTKLCERK